MKKKLKMKKMFSGVQQCCYWVFHQPELPVEADKYRKFK